MSLRVSDKPSESWLTEWPTWLVILAIYGGFGLLTWHYNALTWWLVLPCSAWLIAWHAHLQHEALHGHPTPWRSLNTLIALPSLWLWMPYQLYAESHLRHHRTENLTDPTDDPESFYERDTDWRARGKISHAVLLAHQTLLGRLILGPFLMIGKFWHAEFQLLYKRDLRHLRAWISHILVMAPLLYWVMSICAIPLEEYVLLFVLPGSSLALLRSFTEHRQARVPAHRTAIVEDQGLLALLFLNNNFHVVHHQYPNTAWYRLPAIYHQQRADISHQNNGFVFAGYGEVLRKFGFRRHDDIIHNSDINRSI